MNNIPVFQLKDVSVEFNKHAFTQRSLRESLGSKIKGLTSEKFMALKNINITINEGEHVGIIGRNGAGKSTFLKVITKVIIPTSGQVNTDSAKHIVPLLELGIGFQADLSGRENCYIAGTIIGYTKEEIENKINSIISFSELGDFFDEPVKNYSSGMYARLAFALATDINPEVMLIDEVFGVGDEFFMQKCLARMKQLMSKGLTTVFVAHNVDFLVAQCSRLIWFDKGMVIMDGVPSEVAEAYRNNKYPLKLIRVV